MKVYRVNMKRLALMLLPCAMRRPVIGALVQSAVYGCSSLHGDFMRWHEDIGVMLESNGQVCRLRGRLNDMFNPVERRITIGEPRSDEKTGTLVYLRNEDRHILLPPRSSERIIVINRRGYGGASGYDFIVSVPYALMGQIDEVRLAAIVDTYKLASKRWIINYD